MPALLRDAVEVLNALGAGGWVFCLGPPVASLALFRVTKVMLIPVLCWFAICVTVVLGYFLAPRGPNGEIQGYVLWVLMLLLLNWTTIGLVLLGTAADRLMDRWERAKA